jgi:hypothetical protein
MAILFEGAATSTQQPWQRSWHPEITEMNKNGGKCSPRFKRFLYISTERTPLTPKFQANFPSNLGSVSVSILFANW